MTQPDMPGFVRAFLASKDIQTQRAYREGLEQLRAYMNEESAEKAAAVLLAGGHGNANQVVLGFRTHLLGSGYSAASVNRALSAVRSMVRVARMFGIVPWTLEVPGVKSAKYRDTRGPGEEAVRRILQCLHDAIVSKSEDGDVCRRDAAIVQLLFSHGLRREEVVSLNIGHFDVDAERISIHGKMRTEREWITLTQTSAGALKRWLEWHPLVVGGDTDDDDDPLFVSLSSASAGHRLTGEGLRLMLRKRAAQAGVTVPVRPHGIRHTAITAVLDKSGGDIRKAMRFSRHGDMKTLQIYDDAREDFAKEMADLLEAPEKE